VTFGVDSASPNVSENSCGLDEWETMFQLVKMDGLDQPKQKNCTLSTSTLVLRSITSSRVLRHAHEGYEGPGIC
jgi:hypothetical protein